MDKLEKLQKAITNAFAVNGEDIPQCFDPARLKPQFYNAIEENRDSLVELKRESISLEASQLVYMSVSSTDDFKKVGVRDQAYQDKQATFDESTIKESLNTTISKERLRRSSPKGKDKTSVQVKFFNANMEIDDSVDDILGFYAPPTRHYPSTTQSISRIKEKISSSAVPIPVSENKIHLTTESEFHVIPSADGPQNQWQLEEGYFILKLLKPNKLSISYSASEASSPEIPPACQLSELEENQDKKESDGICSEFLSPFSAARLFVTNTLNQAKDKYRKVIANYADPDRRNIVSDAKVQNVCSIWPAIKDFTREDAVCRIEKYIVEASRFKENWKYTISFEGSQSDAVSDHYFYEAKFGLPNRIYPIPQVTASLFFHIEVSRVIPPQCPVKVLFRAETSRHKIDPETYIIRDNILLWILHVKIHNTMIVNF